MDIDFFKSAREEPLEMAMMMQQMDKLSDLFGDYNDVVSSEYTVPQGSGSSSANTDPSIITNNWSHVSGTASPTFMHHHLASTISFTGASHPVQQQEPPLQAAAELLSFSSRLRNEENEGDNVNSTTQAQKHGSMEAMREMIFRIAAMQPIHIDPESVKPVKRRNVKISKDPQSVAARHRRERISERIRILQRLVPGGTKMDTASMLDEAILYVKFLKKQVQSLEQSVGATTVSTSTGMGFPVPMNTGSFIPLQLQAMKGYRLSSSGQNVEQYY